MNANRDMRTTEDLLRIERVASTLAIRTELERRGYSRGTHGSFVKEPLVHCRMCGGSHPADRSCDCFDNGCQ
jgi:hypothetical protein